MVWNDTHGRKIPNFNNDSHIHGWHQKDWKGQSIFRGVLPGWTEWTGVGGNQWGWVPPGYLPEINFGAVWPYKSVIYCWNKWFCSNNRPFKKQLVGGGIPHVLGLWCEKKLGLRIWEWARTRATFPGNYPSLRNRRGHHRRRRLVFPQIQGPWHRPNSPRWCRRSRNFIGRPKAISLIYVPRSRSKSGIGPGQGTVRRLFTWARITWTGDQRSGFCRTVWRGRI